MMNKSFLSMLLLVLLIFSSSEEMMGRGAEARICKSRNHHYHGLCFSHKCATRCRREGYTGGHCHHFPRHCYCTHSC
ncbi:defensin-like protein 1 [Cucurbita moschata]|uniref:Defensin-like protein 1 n=1 Tax=Cucurbita moschata TaxID=3662 RepID=A0A6J1EVF5_CUCMO|nr:defensin-like protein 1 [Cucurbita moschata]